MFLGARSSVGAGVIGGGRRLRYLTPEMSRIKTPKAPVPPNSPFPLTPHVDLDYLHSVASDAQVAQLVEQGTENPRVGGSSPPLSTHDPRFRDSSGHILVTLEVGFGLPVQDYSSGGIEPKSGDKPPPARERIA